MTAVEKIFARKCGLARVQPGEHHVLPLDVVLGTDITVALSVQIFEGAGFTTVRHPERLVFISDHLVPAKDIASAQLAQSMRRFAARHGVERCYDVGRCGICHVSLPEMGFVVPGAVVVGSDSHTCTHGALGALAFGIGSTDMAVAWATGELWFPVPPTVRVELRGALTGHAQAKDVILHVLARLAPHRALNKVLEFAGPGLATLSIDERLTICNMAVEAGAATGFMPADATVAAYLARRSPHAGETFASDAAAAFDDVIEVDLATIEPLVAVPYSPANVRPARELVGTKLDQVVIGSCTNGRISDFASAFRVLQGRTVHPAVRLILLPGSPAVLRELAASGMLEAFVAAGAVVGPCSCGPCIGGHLGVLAEGEVGLYTTNRNFRGRNGHITSRVYLCNPAVAAASAIRGEIHCP